MGKKVIATDRAPAAVGAYSQAIESEGLVFCSGQVALDPTSGELAGATIAEQTTRCMDNLAAVLAAGGADWSKVIKVTAFLVDMDDFPEFNEAYSAFVGDQPPARATIGVAALPKGARVEVECIARI